LLFGTVTSSVPLTTDICSLVQLSVLYRWQQTRIPTGSSSTKQTSQEWCRSAGRRPTRTECTWCR